MAVFTPTYCQPSDVSSRLLQESFGADSVPDDRVISEYIQEAEDLIDDKTSMAWRTRFSNTQNAEATVSDDYLDYDFTDHELDGESIIDLRKNKVKDLATASGDALLVWDGTSYINYLTAKTSGRGNDYWLENERGYLHIKGSPTIDRNKKAAVRVKFRYGATTVPQQIKKAAVLYVCVQILKNQDKVYRFPEGGSGLTISQKQDTWEREFNEIINDYRGIEAY